jgi:hypothetical protein
VNTDKVNSGRFLGLGNDDDDDWGNDDDADWVQRPVRSEDSAGVLTPYTRTVHPETYECWRCFR